jgi:hypothetical protein
MRRALHDNALSITMFGLFLVFLVAQSVTGYRANNHENQEHGQPPESYAEYNQQQLEHGQATVSLWGFVTSAEFWFQSMQNWQSEFLAVGALAVLGIFLRQRGSPESKPVAAPHSQTGSS